MPDPSPSAPFLRQTWDRMAADYHQEEDPRFAPAVAHVVDGAQLRPGDAVLDLGTGTGSVALKAAQAVGPGGSVFAIDISPEMLRVAMSRAAGTGVANVAFREGSAEAIPADDASADAIASSLCLMFVPDRAAAARECARVLKPGGRFSAGVFGPPERADLPRLQSIIGRFAEQKPPPGIGPCALADPAEFLGQLAAAGIDATVGRATFEFTFPDFETAYAATMRIMAGKIAPEAEPQIRAAIQSEMWPDPASPRVMRQELVLITGRRV
ncbi:MAG: methyltransferase domain-containing protein [Dehalococcoidia bacterium]|nr:MAG: methyltransferase domain-containing protein [Dehalococcoidia bacterium]